MKMLFHYILDSKRQSFSINKYVCTNMYKYYLYNMHNCIIYITFIVYIYIYIYVYIERDR